MARQPKCWVSNLYWCPKSYLNMREVKKHFTLTLYEDAETVDELHCYREDVIRGVKYIGLPKGQPNLVLQCLTKGDLKQFVDKQTYTKAKIPLKFNGEYRDYQVSAISAMSKAKNGVLNAMPRTGKCVVGSTIVPTSVGFFRIQDIPVRDVLQTDGIESYCEPAFPMFVPTLSGVAPVQAIYTRPYVQTYTLRTESGHIITCTDDERFYDGKQWVKLKDLAVGQKIKLQTKVFTPSYDFHQDPPDFVWNKDMLTLLAYLSLSECVGHNTYKIYCNKNIRVYLDILLKRNNIMYAEQNGIYQFYSDIIHKLRGFLNKSRNIPAFILSNKKYLMIYLKGLFEKQFYVRRDIDVFELSGTTLAVEVQSILMSLGHMTIRRGSKLIFENVRPFIHQIGWRGSNYLVGYTPKKFDRYVKINEIAPASVTTVYDLSVGTFEDQHNFVANGFNVHNTVMGTAVLIKKQMKALILAHQTDLCQQFCNETINDPTERLFNGATLKTPVAKICKKYEDFRDTPIAIATYQTFLSKGGQKLLNKIKDMFGVILIDEVHRTPAERYAQVISHFSAAHIYGLTATYDRKDGKILMSKLMIGDVAYKAKASSLAPSIAGTVYRKVLPPSKSVPKTWNGMMSLLFNDPKRNKLIARKAVHYVKRGHTVLIPITQHKHAENIALEIRKLTGDPDIVFQFTGRIPANKRQWARDEMNNNKKIRIVIAQRSMLTGVNIPRWSCLSGDTYIPTNRGLITMENLFPGEPDFYNYTLHNGEKPAKIKFGGRKMYRKTMKLKLRSNYEIESSKGHKFLVLTKEFKLEYVEADKINVGDYVIVKSAGSMVTNYYKIPKYTYDPQRIFGVFSHIDMDGKNHCPICNSRVANLPTHYSAIHKKKFKGEAWTNYQRYQRHTALLQQNIVYPKVVDERLGYILGFLLSDGAVRDKSIEFYNTNPKYINRIKRYMKELFNLKPQHLKNENGFGNIAHELRYNDVRLVDFINFLGVQGRSWEKVIPACIMQSSKSVVSAFLGGHLDGDGSVASIERKGNRGYAEFIYFRSSNALCLKQMQILIFHTYGVLGSYGEPVYNSMKPIIMKGEHTGYFSKHEPGTLVLRNGKCHVLKDHLKKWSTKIHNLNYSESRTDIPYGYEIFKKEMAKFRKKGPNGGYITKGYKYNGHVYNSERKGFGATMEDLRKRQHLLDVFEHFVPDIVDTYRTILNNNLIPVQVIDKTYGNVSKPVYDVSMANSRKPYYVGGAVLNHNCIFTCVPISNEPNYTQEVFRVCTPMDGKPHPEIHYILDPVLGASFGCLRTCCKTLLSKENNFKVKKSFQRVLDYKPNSDVHRNVNEDELVYRSEHGMKNVKHRMRF